MKIKICPRCRSADINLLGGQSWQQASGIPRAKCRNCNYEGPVPEIEIDDNQLKKKI